MSKITYSQYERASTDIFSKVEEFKDYRSCIILNHLSYVEETY